MSEGRRPRDLALLFLATEAEPPRLRARDQRADTAGASLRHELLNKIASLDPDPDELAERLFALAGECDRPSALMFLEEWRQAAARPQLWEFLLRRAVAEGHRE